MPGTDLRFILAVDVKRYTRPEWNDSHRFRQVAALRVLLRNAHRAAGIKRLRIRARGTGDGMVHFLRIGDRGVGLEVVARLAWFLREHNHKHPDPNDRIQLRVAAHSGEVKKGVGFEVSDAVNKTFRMLDSDELRERLGDDDLAVMVSDSLYNEVIVPGNSDSFGGDAFDKVVPHAKDGPLQPAYLLKPGWEPKRGMQPSRLQSFVTWALAIVGAVWARVVLLVVRPVVGPVVRLIAWVGRVPRRWLALGAVALVVVLVAAVVVVVRRPPDCEVPLQLNVLAAASIAEQVEMAAEEFSAERSDPCRPVNVRVTPDRSPWEVGDAVGSGWHADHLAIGPEPAVWIPESTALLERANRTSDQAILATLESIARTPVVLAVEEDFKARFARETSMTWSEVHGWGELLDRGEGRIVRAVPTASGAALLSTVALFDLVTDEPGRQELEQRLRPVTDDERAELCSMGQSDPVGAASLAPRALLTSEQQMLSRNDETSELCAQAVGQPLTAIYPHDDEGRTPVLDYPYALLPAASDPELPEREELARAFHDYLIDADTHRDVLEPAGFRAPDGTAGPSISRDQGADPDQPENELSAPDVRAVGQTVEAWKRARPAARVLLAVDVSESMGQQLEGELETRMAAARTAAEVLVNELSERDEIELRRFAENLVEDPERPGGYLHYEILPVQRREPLDMGAYRDQAKGRLRDLTPVERGTRLLETMRDGITDLRSASPPGTVSAVVVVSDGGDSGTSGVDVDDVLAALDDPQEVLLFLLVFGPAACSTGDLAELAVHQDVRCIDTIGTDLPDAFAEISALMFGPR